MILELDAKMRLLNEFEAITAVSRKYLRPLERRPVGTDLNGEHDVYDNDIFVLDANMQ